MEEYVDVDFFTTRLGLAMGPTGVAIHVVIFINLMFLCFNRRTEPFLPRSPTTIASQLVYLCRSDKLLNEFPGTSMLSENELEGRLENIYFMCGFGWFFQDSLQRWFVGVEKIDGQGCWHAFSYKRDRIYGSRPCT
jgi:hypothetical protein